MLPTAALHAIAALALYMLGSAAVHSQDYSCKDAGPCVCTEASLAKAAIGYNTADNGTERVAITCINMQTLSRHYYLRAKSDRLANKIASSKGQ